MSNIDPTMDPDLQNLIFQLALQGVNPNPAALSVPYAQDYMGGNTNPLRQATTMETLIKGLTSIGGANPVTEYAGPKTTVVTPEADTIASEVKGDPLGEALLQDFNNGTGLLALKKKIVANSYDPSKEKAPNANAITKDEASQYLGWIDRMSKAVAKDNVALGKPGATDNPAEADPYGLVPTDQAMNFDKQGYMNDMASKGEFGPVRQHYGNIDTRQQAYDAGGGFGADVRRTPQELANTTFTPTTNFQMYGGGGATGALGDTIARALAARETSYSNAADRAQASSMRPSQANQTALRRIQALRTILGLSPNG